LVVLVVVVLGMMVLVLRGRCDEDEDVVEFPHTIEIAPGNYLFVDGHEFHGEVVCTWEPGDSVRIEGIPVLPSRPMPRKEPSEAELMGKYGDDAFMLERVDGGMTWKEALREKELWKSYRWNPYISERVDEGMTWDEAVGEYFRRMEETGDLANRAYWKVLEATGSKEKAAAAALDSLDRTVLDPSFEPRVATTGMALRFVGQEELQMAFTYKPPWEMPTLEELRKVTPKKARGLARSVARTLGRPKGTWMKVISSQVGEMTFAGRAVSKALKQIEEGEKGRLTTGPLPERELKLILSVRGVKIDETDE
jgi:hypothetical protein